MSKLIDELPGEQLAWVATIAAYLFGSATSDQGLSPDPDMRIALWKRRPVTKEKEIKT